MLKRLFLTSFFATCSILVPLDITAASTLRIPASTSADSQPDTTLSDSEKVELKRLLVQDCGSCHGLRMTGGLGPALTPAALTDIPRSTLLTTVLYGRPGTAMPPWNAILTEPQAAWIVNQLLEGLTAQ